MAKFTKSLFLATSALGLVSLFAGSAQAASVTGASVSDASDSLVYCADATNTFVCNADPASVLTGDASSPTGNVELRSSSDSTFGAPVTLDVTLDNGTQVQLSSVNATDWAVFGQKWFAQLLNKYTYLSGVSETANPYYSALTNTQKARFSDPNISYVNQDDETGKIKIGLAGHLDAREMIVAALGPALSKLVKPGAVQISEIVKYTHDGVTDYLWSFDATASGLVESGDKVSHSGNYEVAFRPTESVPEPASVLGLMAVGSLIASRKRK
jgi:hypothetical protein